MEYIDKIFYINLDKRTDRKQEIEEELTRMGLNAERYPAIHTTIGYSRMWVFSFECIENGS